MFDALSAAKPVLLAVDGEARDILERSGGGVFVRPGDPGALADAVLALQSDPAACAAMGRSGREFVRRHYLRSEQARAFAEVLEQAAARRQAHPEIAVRAVR
jgi:glycosyltransferase involved in cell wall biosynthesis